MVPVIYPYNETAFTSRGYGALADCIKCEVTEELNGAYQLMLQYPKNGVNQEYLQRRNIIVCSPNHSTERDAFRISKVNRVMTSYITVTAYQLSYDLTGIPVRPFSTTGAANAVYNLAHANPINHSFALSTTLTNNSTEFRVDMLSSIRSWFGGKTGSLIDVFGGEWEYNFFNCALKSSRGADNGARISYGVNMAEYLKEQTADAYSHIMPFFYKKDGDSDIYVNSDPIATGATGIINRALMVNFADQFSDAYGKDLKFKLLSRKDPELSSGTVRPWAEADDSHYYIVNATRSSYLDYANISNFSITADDAFQFSALPTGVSNPPQGVAFPVKVEPDTTYRFSCEVPNSAVQYVSNITIVMATAAGSVISTETVAAAQPMTKIFTTPSNAVMAVFVFYPNTWQQVVSFSDVKLISRPTTAQLEALGNSYLAAHSELTRDNQTITVTPALLSNPVGLGDTVHVSYDSEIISTRVNKTVWDVLSERYTTIELGTKKENIATTIKNLR